MILCVAGLITTTPRKLDREQQAEHVLEVRHTHANPRSHIELRSHKHTSGVRAASHANLHCLQIADQFCEGRENYDNFHFIRAQDYRYVLTECYRHLFEIQNACCLLMFKCESQCFRVGVLCL